MSIRHRRWHTQSQIRQLAEDRGIAVDSARSELRGALAAVYGSKSVAPAKKDKARKLLKDYKPSEHFVLDYTIGKERIHESFKFQREAEEREAELTFQRSKGTVVVRSKSPTVAGAGGDWLTTCAAEELEASTLMQYRQHLELHIVPVIGDHKLADLTVPAVRAFQDRLRREGRSADMVRRVTVSLGSLIADAQSRGRAAHNPVREMKRRSRKSERRHKKKLEVGVDIPTPDEVSRMMAAAPERWRPLLIVAAFTGLRASELRALPWSAVDFKKGAITVKQKADRFQEIGSPKTDTSRRTIPVGPVVVNTLREWRLRCPASDLDLVFATGSGRIEWLQNIEKRALHRAQIAAGITKPKADKDGNPVLNGKGRQQIAAKYTGMHALRHFFASWCINRVADGGLGLPPKLVQQRMGHSTLAMTMDTYGHLFPSSDDGGALAEAERRLIGLHVAQM